MTRPVRTLGLFGAAFGVVCAAGLLVSCSAPRPSFQPEPGVAGVAGGAPAEAGDVRVVYARAGETIEFPEGALLLGRVSAYADARVEGLLPEARKQAERRLVRAAAKAGATLVIVRTDEVVEIEGVASEAAAPVFEDERRDRLSPSGYEPTRPVYRVRLVGDALAEQ